MKFHTNLKQFIYTLAYSFLLMNFVISQEVSIEIRNVVTNEDGTGSLDIYMTNSDIVGSLQFGLSNIETAENIENWYGIINDLTDWSVKFDALGDQGLGSLLEEQWREANLQFTRFIEINYELKY